MFTHCVSTETCRHCELCIWPVSKLNYHIPDAPAAINHICCPATTFFGKALFIRRVNNVTIQFSPHSLDSLCTLRKICSFHEKYCSVIAAANKKSKPFNHHTKCRYFTCYSQHYSHSHCATTQNKHNATQWKTLAICVYVPQATNKANNGGGETHTQPSQLNQTKAFHININNLQNPWMKTKTSLKAFYT